MKSRTILSLFTLILCMLLSACSDLGISSIRDYQQTPPNYSPLTEFIGTSLWDREDEFRQAVDAFVLRREELIAQCMLQNGFEYAPDLYSMSFQITNNAFDEIYPDDAGWVSQYGFGVVSGHRTESGGSIWDTRDDDPNADYVESLSESEREAYFLALNGPMLPPPPSVSISQAHFNEWFRTERGCLGGSVIQAQEENPLFEPRSEEFTPLFEAIAEMNQTILFSPEYEEIHRDWSDCMANLGHLGLISPSAAINRIVDALTHIQINQETSLTNLRRMILQGEIPEGSRLQQQETELALADLTCRQAVSFSERAASIRHRAEAQFVADHRVLLEAYREYAAQRD